MAEIDRHRYLTDSVYHAVVELRRAHPELGADEAEQIIRYLPVAGAELAKALRAALDAGQADSAVLAAALRDFAG